jgi:parallel beta-helix repeat protein
VGIGLWLWYSSGNTLTDNTASNNAFHGIMLNSGSGSTLTGNTANSNNSRGIWLNGCNSSTLTNNTAASNDSYGIYLFGSRGCTMRSNTMTSNRYNFRVGGYTPGAVFDHDIDTSNIVDGRLIYYVVGEADKVYDSSTAENAGTFYAINCDNITVKDLTLSKNGRGVCLWNTHNSTIENVTASDNDEGIYLDMSGGSTVTGNTVSNNNNGIVLRDSDGSTLTDNTAWNNSNGIVLVFCNNSTVTNNIASDGYDTGILLYRSNSIALTENTASNNSRGISLAESNNNSLTGNTVAGSGDTGIWLFLRSSNNQIYNNNFIDNAMQVRIDYGTIGNVFNLDRPTGGNYWSDWTTPDDDGDGYVDYPYLIYNDRGHLAAQDNLPWVRLSGWFPPQAIQALVVQVMTLNLQQGIGNSLDAKLDTALKALDDINENNDDAAINTMQAFINAVEAQSGNQISTEDADALIAAAQEIIDILNGS